MGYLAVWKVLEEMVTDFKRRGVNVPASIISDLKSARTIIKVLGADPSYGENAQKVEEYLGNVESYLIVEGQKRFGQTYGDKWLTLRSEAGLKTSEEEEEKARFISGVPREHNWIRVKASEELPLEKLKALAEESNLSCKEQAAGVLLVFGPETEIKNFVKKIAAKPNAETRKRTSRST